MYHTIRTNYSWKRFTCLNNICHLDWFTCRRRHRVNRDRGKALCRDCNGRDFTYAVEKLLHAGELRYRYLPGNWYHLLFPPCTCSLRDFNPNHAVHFRTTRCAMCTRATSHKSCQTRQTVCRNSHPAYEQYITILCTRIS